MDPFTSISQATKQFFARANNLLVKVALSNIIKEVDTIESKIDTSSIRDNLAAIRELVKTAERKTEEINENI